MVNLHAELLQRFPELRDGVQDYAELPYVLMSCLAGWLAKRQPDEMTTELVERVLAFAEWCEEQPCGDTASDDLYTMLVVGFYEDLFRADLTRKLLPRLIPKDELIDEAEYWKQWVGQEDYSRTLAQYSL